MKMQYNRNTHAFVGEDSIVYRIFDIRGDEICDDTKPIPLYSIAVPDLRIDPNDEEQVERAVRFFSDKIQNFGYDCSVCQHCTRAGALSGCPKQASAIYKSLSEREDPVEGWNAEPVEYMSNTQVGDIVVPTLVRGWNVHTCPLFRFRFWTQGAPDFIRFFRATCFRLNAPDQWGTIEVQTVSKYKEKFENFWETVYGDIFPLICERDEDEEDE